MWAAGVDAGRAIRRPLHAGQAKEAESGERWLCCVHILKAKRKEFAGE